MGSISGEINVTIERLHCKRILAILDDVEKLDEVDQLLGRYDWFGFGSRIIITTRDRHFLDMLEKDCHVML